MLAWDTAMTHSVSRHLNLAIADYDRTIRRFIPGYDTMLDVVVAAVRAAAPQLVLDLGAGTGALAERLLAADPTATVELWDVDPAMLEVARERLGRHGGRARFRLQSFADPLPRADAVMASLALHHVRTLPDKATLYGRIGAALEPGGVFVNGDVTLPDDPEARERGYERWADHLVAEGFARNEARRHFADWAAEDVYFPVERELEAISAAGLEARMVWRQEPNTVTAGTKPR